MVRGLGTNNLPDCSNMCHESSGSALTETIGIGKGSVSLEDIYQAELILIAGQNPGTNHPRMLSALEKAKKNGAVIVAVNPLPEAGLMRFENPQTVRGLVGGGTALADDFLQIKLGGDQALFQGLGKFLLEEQRRPGSAHAGRVFDTAFIEAHTTGLGEYLQQLEAVTWAEIVTATGLSEDQIRATGERLLASKATVVCWAMGLTQHKHSVATLRDVVNVLLLQGNIGKPGAGVCPVRGHSNVQGDRTMGIFERMPAEFHDALDAEFSFASPRAHGFDTVAAIEAMRDGKAGVFLGMGGNFVRATPDSAVTEKALNKLVADGADLHEAEQVAPGHGPSGTDPAHPGPHRTRHPGRRRPARHRGGLHERRPRLARAAGPGVGQSAAPRWPLCARLAKLLFQTDDGGTRPGAPARRLGRPGRGLQPDPDTHCRRRARL